SNPEPTILGIARAMGRPLGAAEVAAIWRKLDHVNLTGAHRHNLRAGHGVVGGWRRWLTNTHLEMMCDYGLDRLVFPFGYDLSERLDETAYNSFQRRVAGAIRDGSVVRAYTDEDLFGFAFNKSNLNLDRFAFKRYGWRNHTQIERSSFGDDELVMDVWNTAEESCAIFNSAINNGLSDTERAASAVAVLFEDEASWLEWRGQLDNAKSRVIHDPAPKLLRSVRDINVVQFGGRYYGVPQKLGPIDFYTAEIGMLEGIIVEPGLTELLRRLETIAP
ncbi:MAG TPA: hypothetical protein PLY97_10340, partial [Acidocella sp.]|nr:hypothetical protein [Acidocella sp.]